MKKITLLSALFIALLIGACSSDETGVDQITTDLDINVTATFGGEALQMHKEYTLCDGKAIKFAEFNLFISDIVLLKENDPQAAVTELKEIDFLELSFTNEMDAMAGETINFQKVPVGDYSGIRLGLGVIADLNRTKPIDYGSSSPLSKTSHYWDMTQSYVFAKITGYADFDENGEIVQGGTGAEGFTYHIGSDPTYNTAQIIKDIALVEGENGTFKLNMDVASIFDTNSPIYDGDIDDDCLEIATYKAAHTDDLDLGAGMMSNLAKSITIEF